MFTWRNSPKLFQSNCLFYYITYARVVVGIHRPLCRKPIVNAISFLTRVVTCGPIQYNNNIYYYDIVEFYTFIKQYQVDGYQYYNNTTTCTTSRYLPILPNTCDCWLLKHIIQANPFVSIILIIIACRYNLHCHVPTNCCIIERDKSISSGVPIIDQCIGSRFNIYMIDNRFHNYYCYAYTIITLHICVYHGVHECKSKRTYT